MSLENLELNMRIPASKFPTQNGYPSVQRKFLLLEKSLNNCANAAIGSVNIAVIPLEIDVMEKFLPCMFLICFGYEYKGRILNSYLS